MEGCLSDCGAEARQIRNDHTSKFQFFPTAAAGDVFGYGLHGEVLFLLVGHDTRRTLIVHGMLDGSTLRAVLRHETGCSPEFTQKTGWFTQASQLYT